MILVNERGVPIPPSSIVERLQRIDPHLNLRFIEQYGDNPNARWWALTWDWPESDPRQEYVRRGEIGEAFDILGYLPFDCPVDQAAPYIERVLKQQTGREETARLLERLHLFNAEVTKAAKQPVLERAEELTRVNAPTLLEKEGKRVPKVFISSKRTSH